MADAADRKPRTGEETPPSRPAVGLWIGAGVGAGIGSAAIAAALLTTNRRRKQDGKA